MHILIVEDEARIARRLERMCCAILGDSAASVTLAGTLSEAMALIINNPVDLLLLDLNLSGDDGFELLRQAVAGSFHTIIISAYKEQAITAFERALRCNTMDEASYLGIGRALASSGEYAPAVQAYTLALELDADNADA